MPNFKEWCLRRSFSMIGKGTDPQTRRFYLSGRQMVKEYDILGWSDIQRCLPDCGRRSRLWFWLCKLCLCLRRICWLEILRTGLRSWKEALYTLYSLAFTLLFPPCLKLLSLFFYPSCPTQWKLKAFLNCGEWISFSILGNSGRGNERRLRSRREWRSTSSFLIGECVSLLEECIREWGKIREASLEERRSPVMEGVTKKRGQPLRGSLTFSLKLGGGWVGWEGLVLRGSSRETSVLRIDSRTETVLEEMMVFFKGKCLGCGFDSISELWFIFWI